MPALISVSDFVARLTSHHDQVARLARAPTPNTTCSNVTVTWVPLRLCPLGAHLRGQVGESLSQPWGELHAAPLHGVTVPRPVELRDGRRREPLQLAPDARHVATIIRSGGAAALRSRLEGRHPLLRRRAIEEPAARLLLSPLP